MGNESYARMAPFMELQRRARAASQEADRTAQWATRAVDQGRCHMVLATTGVSISIGTPVPITTPWPGDQFFAADGSDIPYGIEILPTGLLGKGSYALTASDSASATVTITATLVIAIGTQFILHGCSRLPAS